MSFSSRVKNEICRIEDQSFCCDLAELTAMIQVCGSIYVSGRQGLSLRINTENPGVARRMFSLFKRVYDAQVEIVIKKKQRLRKNNNYYLILSDNKKAIKILSDIGIIKGEGLGSLWINHTISQDIVEKRCCKRAYIRGAFLGAGSLSDPEKIYHLEIVTHNETYAISLCGLLNEFGLGARIIERKGNYVIYLKEGDHIVNLLNIIGAHSALLDLENIRIYKDMRNNINRIVNCETANLGKTINAALRQIDNIHYLRDKYGLSKLSLPLREIALLRINNPDSSLKELGEMLDPPIGKSGVNHRLRKIDKLAEDIRNKRGEANDEKKD